MKYTTLNNHYARSIIKQASCGNIKLAYSALINCKVYFDEPTFHRLIHLVFDICPLTYKGYMELHPQIQQYLNSCYVKYIQK